MSNERTKIAVAVMGAGLVASIAVQTPAAVPALTLALAAFLAAVTFLRL
ncbi:MULTISPECIES: hypothetical protein [unclassified Streptomyces]|nr:MULTISPECIES: hypothetical protein [unclassified Streptomyces]